MRIALYLLLLLGLGGVVRAADQVDYLRDIKTLLSEKCSACHGALKQQAGLRLDAGVLIRKGSDGGPVVVPGNAAESLLIEKVTAKDPGERMPPEGEGEPLSAEQVASLSVWINTGAPVPDDEAIPASPSQHWAYQVLKRPPVPHAADPQWSRPIDAFVSHHHQRLGLTPVQLADRYTLLRRVYLDVIGLPPSPQQLSAFMEDQSPGAWDKVVHALLDRPEYGERWGRHWMDVWRYSDWDGYKNQLRGSQRHIWRWRDWIVRSLNSDKGYDQMIVEMLAGDEVAPGDPAVLAATGFLARNYHHSNRNIWLDATVEHTAKALLGLTLNCARCHDHKYDPIPQSAYYEFRAIFEPHQVRTDQIPGQPDVMKDGLPRAYDADLSAKTFLFLQGNEKHPDQDNPIASAVPAVLGGNFEIQPVELPLEAYYPSLRDFVVNQQIDDARRQLASAQKSLSRALSQMKNGKGVDEPGIELLKLKQSVAWLRVQSLQARLAAERAKLREDNREAANTLAHVAADVERQFHAEHAQLAVREKRSALSAAQSSNEADQPKKPAEVAKLKNELADAQKKLHTTLQALDKSDGDYTTLGKQYPRTSSGRRLALARWIVTKSNPLTARVAVNHIWMRHFGSPLVDNVFDFGLRSPRPQHADLLDWLAVELMENDWSMKHLHRLIVTSRTWQLASSAAGSKQAAANQLVDRDNHWLWRMNVRRLDAEVIRDSVLAVSGQLDASQGGPDIDFQKGEESRRRSIYLRHAYEKQMTMLVLFDAASPTECYRRSASIVPQQALALSNSSLSLGQSRLLARKLWKEVTAQGNMAEAAFVRSAFLATLSRPPDREELTACLQFLAHQAATLSDTSKLTTFAGGTPPKVKPAKQPQQRALENLVHVLMNHNDFVSVR